MYDDGRGISHNAYFGGHLYTQDLNVSAIHDSNPLIKTNPNGNTFFVGETIITLADELVRLRDENQQLKQKLEEQEERLRAIEIHLEYMPYSNGYFEANEDFNIQLHKQIQK